MADRYDARGNAYRCEPARFRYKPEDEDFCSLGGHRYYGDDCGVGSCYCGEREYPPGGPEAKPR